MNLTKFVNDIKETVGFKEGINKDDVVVKASYDKHSKKNLFIANNKYFYLI